MQLSYIRKLAGVFEGEKGLLQALEQKTGISHFKGKSGQNLAVSGYQST
jgi:hypothetical protein